MRDYLNNIERSKAMETKKETTQGWDGRIPEECNNTECGNCPFTEAQQKEMGCTVDPFGEEKQS